MTKTRLFTIVGPTLVVASLGIVFAGHLWWGLALLATVILVGVSTALVNWRR